VEAPRHKLTAHEYLAWERAQPTKHEYFRGEVFAMAGASVRHNALCSELIRDRNLRPRRRDGSPRRPSAVAVGGVIC
jgi:Uma2 family endonuclease